MDSDDDSDSSQDDKEKKVKKKKCKPSTSEKKKEEVESGKYHIKYLSIFPNSKGVSIGDYSSITSLSTQFLIFSALIALIAFSSSNVNFSNYASTNKSTKDVKSDRSREKIVGSVCKVSSAAERKISEPEEAMCSENVERPSEQSTRQCPPCTTGENCQHSTSFEKLKAYIIRGSGSFAATYGGYPISCHNNMKIHGFQLKWDCTCIDINTGQSRRCKKYESSFGACEHALSELIRGMASQGTYPQPCDPQKLKTRC